MPSVRLLLVSPLPPPVGGIATWTRILLAELARGTDVAVQHLDTAVRWRAVTRISPWARLTGGAVQALRDYLRLRRMLLGERPDVVHICTSAGLSLAKDLLMIRAVRRLGGASVIHVRMGRIPSLARSSTTEWLRLKACAETASVALVLDERSASTIAENCPNADVRTMPNLVDICAVDAALAARSRAESSAADRFSISYAGHILPAKGVTDLVQAAVASGRGMDLVLVGPVEERYKRTLDGMADGAGGRVRLGYRGTLSHEDTLREIARASVFALPSHSEGFPNVVAEAMACGRAVLGTDVGAIPEMLTPQGPAPCGSCVPVGDVAGMAATVRDMHDDAVRRAAMGRNGRTKAEREYSAPVVAGRLAELWRSITR